MGYESMIYCAKHSHKTLNPFGIQIGKNFFYSQQNISVHGGNCDMGSQDTCAFDAWAVATCAVEVSVAVATCAVEVPVQL